MSNVDRVLTLVIKITDHEKSKWIWDLNIRDNSPFKNELGIEVCSIEDGNIPKEMDETIRKYDNEFGELPEEGEPE